MLTEENERLSMELVKILKNLKYNNFSKNSKKFIKKMLNYFRDSEI